MSTLIKAIKNCNRLELLAWILLVTTSFIILFYRLGNTPVQSWDEGFYALVAEDTGSLGVIPSIHSSPWLEKPPLGFWIIAASFRILGISAFSLRLPAALFSLATLFLLVRLGKQFGSIWVGFLAAFLFLTSPIFLHPHHMARSGDLDTMLTFTVVGSFLFYLESLEKPRHLLLAAGMVGLGIMLRGIPLFIIIATIVVHTLSTRSYKKIPGRYWIYSLLIILGMTLPWHLYAWLRYGQEFINVYFLYTIVQRTVGVIDNHRGPFTYYHSFMLERWGALLVLSYLGIFWSLWKGIAEKKFPYLLLALWTILYGGIISYVHTKLFWYVLPIIPALCLAVVSMFREIVKKYSSSILYLISLIMIILWLSLPSPVPFMHSLTRRTIAVGAGIVLNVIIYRVVKKLKPNWFLSSFPRLITVVILALISITPVIRSFTTLREQFFHPSRPAIASIAETLERDYTKQDIVVSTIQEIRWINNWISPQAEWYLNMRHHLNVHYFPPEELSTLASSSPLPLLITEPALLPLLPFRDYITAPLGSINTTTIILITSSTIY